MNTPDQLDALRAHLDEALAGVGDSLPAGAAPALLQTARRRARTRRIAAGAGGAVVMAALVVGVGSQLTTSTGRNPTVIAPATAPPSAVSTAQPSTPGTPPASTAPSSRPSVADHAGLQVLAQRSIDTSLLGGAGYATQTFGNTAVFLGPGDATVSVTAPGRLVSVDLESGYQTTLVTDMPQPLGGFTEAGGNLYVAEAAEGKPVIDEYSAVDGAKVRELSLPLSTDTDCSPTGCLKDQVVGTRLVEVGNALTVTTPGAGNKAVLVTFDLTTGEVTSTVRLDVQNLDVAGVIGDTVYLYDQGEVVAVRAGKVIKTAQLTGGDGSGLIVTAQGIYYVSRNDGGGPDPARAIVLTLQRLDPVTLKVTATSAETLAKGVTTSTGVTVAVVNKILYTSIGTCPTAPTTDICVQRRDPVTLALQGTVLRTTGTSGANGYLVQGEDGAAALLIRGPANASEQIDLLGAAPAG